MSRSIASAAIWITAITFLSRITGFIRDVILAAMYGTTIESDAFIMAQSIIGVVSGLLIAALGTTFIPVMSDYLQSKSTKETTRFLNVVYTVAGSLSIVICLLGLLFTEQIVNVFSPNFSDEASKLTIQLTAIMMPVVVLSTIVTLNSAKLQNHGQYLIPASIGLPLNFAMIMTMLLLTDHYGVYGLAASFVAGTILQIVLQWPFVRKLGYRFRPVLDLKEEGLRRIGLLIIPIMIGSGLQQINTLVDRILASGLPEGSVAALNYSNRLSLFIINLFSVAVATVYYTSMSNYFAAGQTEAFKKLLRNTINLSIVFIVPASVGIIVLRLPIVKMIFERGLFDHSASETTAIALYFYTFGLVGFLLRDVLSRAFYAIKDTKTAMINGSVAVVLNIVLSIILVRYIGLGGLALGTSLSALIGTGLLAFSLAKKIGGFGQGNILTTLGKVTAPSAVMGISVHYMYQLLMNTFQSNTLSVLAVVIFGVLVYAGMLKFMKIEEVDTIAKMLISKLRRLQNK